MSGFSRNGVNVNTTTLTLFPENTQAFSFSQPQTVCQHTAYSPTLLVSDWLARQKLQMCVTKL